MEIVRTETVLARTAETLSGFERQTEERLVNAVAAMFGNLNVYGKKWAPAIGQGWLMALRLARDVTPDEFQAACCHWLESERDFPAPADVLGWIRGQREDQDTKEALRLSAIQAKAEQAERIAAWRDKHGITDDTPPEEVRAIALKAIGAIEGNTHTMPTPAEPRNDHEAERRNIEAREALLASRGR